MGQLVAKMGQFGTQRAWSVPDSLKGTKSTGLRPRASGGLAPWVLQRPLVLLVLRVEKRKNGRREKSKKREKWMNGKKRREEGDGKEGGEGRMEEKKGRKSGSSEIT